MSEHEKGRVLVSACLVGIKCRYDGGDAFNDKIDIDDSAFYIPVCPEQLGGLPTPREPAEIVSGSGEDVLLRKSKVVGTETGSDYSENFIKGAKQVLKIAQIFGCSTAVLKSNSPSCGKGKITRNGEYVAGNGITAALLMKSGVNVEVL